MQNLDQFYTAVGGRASEIIARLGGSAALVQRFLGKFPADGSLAELREALSSGDTKTAFRAAHTLKGLCANLGLENLRQRASDTTELLRDDRLDDARASLPALEAEYAAVLAALKGLGIS